MRFLKRFFVILFTAVIAGSAYLYAQKPGAALDSNIAKPPVPKPVKVTQLPDAKREWTVMLYMNAKNNLDYAAILDMKELEAVGSDKNVAFVVEAGLPAEWGSPYEKQKDAWSGTKRFFITPQQNVKTVSRADINTNLLSELIAESKVLSPALMNIGESDMGDYKNVVKFAKWAKEKYPANKYMLILWSHGHGVLDIGRPKNEAEKNTLAKEKAQIEKDKGISPDWETDNYIRTHQLAMILKEIGGVDIFATDACLMQMAEVINYITPYAKFIIGSEEPLPAYGYNYIPFAKALTLDPSLSAEDASKILVKGTGEFYKDSILHVTLSAIRASKFDAFKAALNSWVKTVMALPVETLKPGLIKARQTAWRMQAYGGSWDEGNAKREIMEKYSIQEPNKPAKTDSSGATVWKAPEYKMELSNFVDLYDFVNILAENVPSKELHNASRTLLDAVKEMMVIKYTEGKTLNGVEVAKHSWNLAIGLPRQNTLITDKMIEEYFELDRPYLDYPFAKNTEWGNFYRWFDATARE